MSESASAGAAGGAAASGGDSGAAATQSASQGATQSASGDGGESVKSVTTQAGTESVEGLDSKAAETTEKKATEETTEEQAPKKKTLKDFTKEQLKRFYESEDFGDDDDSLSGGLEKLFAEHDDVKTKYNRHVDGTKKLSAIIGADPVFGKVIQSMLADGDTLPVALAKHYDLDQLTLKEGDEGWEAFTQAEKNRKESHKNEQLHKESIQKNKEKTVKLFNDFIAKNYGEDKEGAESFISWVDNTIVSILRNDINPNVIEKLHQGFKYEIAVEEAKEEGLLAGRNQQISEKFKADTEGKKGDGVPQIGKSVETKETETDPFLQFKPKRAGLRL